MKGFKKFLIYLCIILGIILTIGLIFFAVMYFSPNTTILGFRYVSYKSSETKVFNSSSDPSVQNVQSVEIFTDNCDIYIYPNDQSGEIKVVELQDFTGFAREVNSTLKIEENASSHLRDMLRKTILNAGFSCTDWCFFEGKSDCWYEMTVSWKNFVEN